MAVVSDPKYSRAKDKYWETETPVKTETGNEVQGIVFEHFPNAGKLQVYFKAPVSPYFPNGRSRAITLDLRNMSQAELVNLHKAFENAISTELKRRVQPQ